MSVKCLNCGSTNIDTDPSRGDSVCVECGVVTEAQMIVNEVQFQETSSGQAAATGEFLSSDSTGARVGHLTNQASRELTIYRARKEIVHLCKQLMLTDCQSELAVNFYKQVLSYNLTRGRKQTLTYAGCIYLACRIERTPHLLIDISDVVQIDVYELGRTYLKFVQALYLENAVDGAVNIDGTADDPNPNPIKAIDPCLYIMRYANKLEFGSQTSAVIKTALRLVSRMKRDNIHTGRRPSGICGAALLIAARMHDFNRTVGDIIKIVKIHESTLRKRLLEFGDTPSSALTLEDFESIDLAEEEDPPAFKASRKAEDDFEDFGNIDGEFTDLQKEIDKYLSEQQSKKRSFKSLMSKSAQVEDIEANRFIEESTLEIADEFVDQNEDRGLGPDISMMGLPTSFYDSKNTRTEGGRFEKYNNESGEIDLDGLDDEELDGYILKDADVVKKTELWTNVHAEYLEMQKLKEEQRLRDEEEGRPVKKRKIRSKKSKEPANSAGEAVENMMKEKRLSKKLNYDVIREMKGEKVVKFGGKNNNNFKSVKNEVVGFEEEEGEGEGYKFVDNQEVENSFVDDAGIQDAEVEEDNYEDDEVVEDNENYGNCSLEKILGKRIGESDNDDDDDGGNEYEYDDDYEEY
ncbi:transcription factor IIIB 90 kDa subunit-like [Microplitis mediator]|uniref:transcription factor IIIB 90 kDa subunit-like n=1 Tax=Microplitis mediator TaxID=375433 RepID=UPI0025542505|nr:transcription factor IIIB 90 kDa subunit-like [Microplitis mediator]